MNERFMCLTRYAVGLLVVVMIATGCSVSTADIDTQVTGATAARSVPRATRVQVTTANYLPYSGGEWTIDVLGMVPSRATRFTEDGGVCTTMLGVITADEVPAGSLAHVLPTITAVANDGRHFDVVAGSSGCVKHDVEKAGYLPMDRAVLARGSSFAFFVDLVVPQGTTPNHVVFETESGGPTVELQRLEAVPAAPALGEPGAFVANLQQLSGARIEHTSLGGGSIDGEDLGSNDWLIELEAAVRLPSTEDSSCIALVGYITLIDVEDPTDPAQFTPGYSIVADGRLQFGGSLRCDPSSVEVAGYRKLGVRDFVVGERVPFFVMKSVAGVDARIDAVAFELGADYLFAPDLVDTAPVPVSEVGATRPAPSDSVPDDAVVLDTPTPAPRPTVAVEPEIGEPASGLTTGRAVLFAVGTGGSCPEVDSMWAAGFTVRVYVGDLSITELLPITTEVWESPVVSAVITVPGDDAWLTLVDELGSSSYAGTFTRNDLGSAFELIIFGFDGAQEESLEILLDDLRSIPGVLAITDGRCTDKPNVQLIED